MLPPLFLFNIDFRKFMMFASNPLGGFVGRVVEASKNLKNKNLLIDDPEIIEKLKLIQLAVGDGNNPFAKHKELISRLCEVGGDRYYSKSVVIDKNNKSKLVTQFKDNHFFKQLADYTDKKWGLIVYGINLPHSRNFPSKDKAIKLLTDLQNDIYDNRQEYAKRLGIGEYYKSVTIER